MTVEALSDAIRLRIRDALAEDIGEGDWTTLWSVAEGQSAAARILAKGTGVVAGFAPAAEVFDILGGAKLKPLVAEGSSVEVGDPIAEVAGSARSILSGERLALNFLGRLSGVASLTRRFVEAVAGTGVRITDTRKTTPLWRELERAATRAGGAVNHRRGLDAMVLIKENHIASAGGIESAVRRIREMNDRGLRVEVETTGIDEVKLALAAGVDRIMLDNMSLPEIRDAVKLIRAHTEPPEIEASGGVSLQGVRELAETGVDLISIGALTHSAPALDVSLRIQR